MRTIGVVTVARSDYGIYVPLLEAIESSSSLNLHLIVSGAHLSPEFGRTIGEIISDGFPIGDQSEMLLSSDSPEGIVKSIGLGVIGYGQSFTRFRPDILVTLGDRFEMFAAALAALPFKIPVAHIHGGELTAGAIDDALRHAMTKLSHLHFTSTEKYAKRVIQLGEEPWRVVNSGALSLDNLKRFNPLNREGFERAFGILLPDEYVLVTYHPVTLEYEQTEWQVKELIYALQEYGCPALFTMPNADTGGRVIRDLIQDFIRANPDSQAVENLGTQGYFSAMKMAEMMVGNSSSGIIEAAMFKLPVVNIGTRQDGRIRGDNVIDVGNGMADILEGIHKATSPQFRAALDPGVSPYGDGTAADRIVKVLTETEFDDRLVRKQFHDEKEE